jgi:hypothetical protein
VHRFNVLADHFQVILMDRTCRDDFGLIWTDEAARLMLAVGERTISVGTLRNVEVTLEVHVSTERPVVGVHECDHMAEACLQIPSGDLVVMNCTAHTYAPTIDVRPGSYQCLFTVSGIDSIENEWSPAADLYRVFLWPGPRITPRLLKHWREDV